MRGYSSFRTFDTRCETICLSVSGRWAARRTKTVPSCATCLMSRRRSGDSNRNLWRVLETSGGRAMSKHARPRSQSALLDILEGRVRLVAICVVRVKEVAARNSASNLIDEVAHHTGRFPQLAHPWSCVNRTADNEESSLAESAARP